MRKVLTALGVSGMLIAGAFVASTLSLGAASAQTTDTAIVDDEVGPREAVLDEVVQSLIDDGTITEDEAVIVKERFVAKHEELAAEREARQEQRREDRELIRGFLDDDVISASELAQLPDDHPLRNTEGVFSSALEDGQITRDELDQVRAEHRQDRRERRMDRRSEDAGTQS
jgi:hypothetical protein